MVVGSIPTAPAKKNRLNGLVDKLVKSMLSQGIIPSSILGEATKITHLAGSSSWPRT